MGLCVRLASIAMLLFVSIGALTQEIDLAKIKPIIIGAAEELRRASRKRELSMYEYQAIMNISCDALVTLSRDDNFKLLMREYERRQYDEEIASAIPEIFLNFRSFLEFLVVERSLLLDAGLSEEGVDAFLGHIMTVRLEAVGFKFDAEALLTNLTFLTEQACSASEDVSDWIENDEIWCNIERIGVFALGAGVTVADGVAFFVPSLGITQTVATASGMLGGTLMAAAAMMPQC